MPSESLTAHGSGLASMALQEDLSSPASDSAFLSDTCRSFRYSLHPFSNTTGLRTWVVSDFAAGYLRYHAIQQRTAASQHRQRARSWLAQDLRVFFWTRYGPTWYVVGKVDSHALPHDWYLTSCLTLAVPKGNQTPAVPYAILYHGAASMRRRCFLIALSRLGSSQLSTNITAIGESQHGHSRSTQLS